MPKRHKVAIYTTVPDKVLFGLTARQLLVLLVGGALAYRIWLTARLFPLWELGIWAQILPLLVVVPVMGLALLVAFVSIANRPLEIWALVWLRYQFIPKRYVWRSARWRTRHAHELESGEGVQGQESEELW